MSLLKEIEDLKAELVEVSEAEKELPEEEEEQIEEKESEEPEKVEEPPKEEEKPAEKPDDAAFARLRREAAASKKLAEDMRLENEALKKPKETEESTESPVAAELEQIIQDSRVTRAEREFMRYESDVLRADPANAHIMAEYTQAIQGSLRLQNPRASLFEIAEMTKRELFRQAGGFQSEGYANPVEEMLNTAKELGFTGKSFAPKEEPKKEPKPDMAKVAENQKRSAGMTAAPGRADGLVSKKTAAEMTPAEWKALDRTERARLMSV